MEGLAHLFKRYCAESWKKGESLSEAGKKFSWAPRKIVALANNQSALRYLMCTSDPYSFSIPHPVMLRCQHH
jgi:hypothetical protein